MNKLGASSIILALQSYQKERRYIKENEMAQGTQQEARNWWAADDTPIHRDSHVAYLVDGRVAMLEMCRHFLTARHYIYLANWGLTATMEMVRGKDHRAGADGS